MLGVDHEIEVESRAITALAEQGDFQSAGIAASDLLRKHPNHWLAISTMADLCHKQDEYGVGYNLLKRVVQMVPNSSGMWNNLAMHAMGCMNHDEAERHCKEALRLDPKNWRAMNNLALVYVNKCEPGLAIEWSKKALSYEPGDTGANETLGYAYLMLGKWDPGWKCWEGSLNGKVRVPRKLDAPYWDGSPVDTLVVRGEQGIGDEVSFASMIPSIKGVKRLIVECDRRLEGLFTRSFPDLEVYGSRHLKETPDWGRIDAHVLSGSLGQYYRLRDEDFPGTPYLVADPDKRKAWRAALDRLGPKPKIGIAWTGGRHTTHRKRRSLRLEEMLPILRQDAEFVSLEYRAPDDEIADLEAKHGIRVSHFRETEAGGDYDDAAALVAELDLVIAAQTSIIHLAGGLGVGTWAILPSKPLWRYRLEGEKFLWADSVRLFRQKKDWSEVIHRVAQKLGAR